MLTRYVALLRAVNVGGTGKLPMSELKAMCESVGFTHVRTYIASGNVIFSSTLVESRVKEVVQQPLQQYAGKPVGVIIRSATEMAQVVANNPFCDCPGNRVVAIFLDRALPADALNGVKNQNQERLACGAREIYVDYGVGMADSRLAIPIAKSGTARNINTVKKLAELSGTA